MLSIWKIHDKSCTKKYLTWTDICKQSRIIIILFTEYSLYRLADFETIPKEINLI